MWDILGISPTSDIKAIKRAYALKLKQTHPQDDPVGFQALRQAYEWALQEAKYIQDDALKMAAGVAKLKTFALEPDGFAEASANTLEIQNISANAHSAIEPFIEPKPATNNDLIIEIIDPPAKENTGLDVAPSTPDPLITTLQQQTVSHLFQQATIHASTLLKLLEGTDEATIKTTLSAYFEHDWFIHIDAKPMLEAQLIKDINARRVSPSHKVFAALMEFFDWGNETRLRNLHDENAIASIRWLFRYSQEENAIKTAREKGWSKERFLALVKNPPKPIAFRFYAFNFLVYQEAQRKLKLWDEEFPDIYTQLNPESVAWWRDKLAGNIGPLFNFGSNSIFVFFGASFGASFISVVFSSITGFIEFNSIAYTAMTWILTLVLFLRYSMHRDKTSEIAPYGFSWLKALMSNLRQFLKSRQGRLISFGFNTINSLLLLVTFNDWLWLVALISLYFSLLLWLEIKVFKWAFFSAMAMFMLAEFIPNDFNNKSSALHLLGMVVSGLVIQKINKMNERQKWRKAKYEYIFGSWLLLMLVLPIILYAQMPWLIEKLSLVTAYLSIIANELGRLKS